MTRLLDICVSGLALLVVAPLMVLIAVAVGLDAGRPVLFSQLRVGRNGQLFRTWKYRTMSNNHEGICLTVRCDTRVTKSGVFLRASKLDELPQLWNVLRGDMAIVGPRPELRSFVMRYPEQYAILLNARPGIVDPASLAFYDEAGHLAMYDDPVAGYVDHILPRKLALSTEYMGIRNSMSDVRIVFHAIRVAAKTMFR